MGHQHMAPIVASLMVDPEASWQDAAAAAADAVAEEASHIQRHYQLASSVAHTGARFATYWADWLISDLGNPERGFDRRAVRQIYDALSEQDRNILTLAGVLTNNEIADQLGLTASAVSLRLSKARRSALALWYDWETPPAKFPRARVAPPHREVCDLGHPLTPRRSPGQRMQWRCRPCEASRARERAAS